MRFKFLFVLSFLFLSVGSFAQETESQSAETHKEYAHGKHGKRGKRKAMLESIPDLTEDQKAKMKQIKKDSREANKAQHEELKSVREKLRAEKTAENPDLNQVNALIDKMHGLQANLDKAKAEAHIKALSVLTPEQRKVFKEEMKKKQAEREQRHMERKKMRESK